MMYMHYFQSDSSKVVTHKPVNLEVHTLAAGLKRTFTIAIKTSEDKIKRRLNKTCPLHEVFLTSENDPPYMERARRYAALQAEQAQHAAHLQQEHDGNSPVAPVPHTKAQMAHRHEQLHYIGSKEIFTNHPGGGIVCIKLRAAEGPAPPADKDKDKSADKEKGADKSAGADADASLDGFLYSVETKGGKSLGRQKQRYILLKRSCIYSLLLPSEILVTKIETKDKHGETVVMKHWISSTAQLTSSNPSAASSSSSSASSSASSASLAAQQQAQLLLQQQQTAAMHMHGMNGLLHMSAGLSPANVMTISPTGGMASMPMNPFAHLGFGHVQASPLMNTGMALNNLSPFNLNLTNNLSMTSLASMSTGTSPARATTNGLGINGISPRNAFNFMPSPFNPHALKPHSTNFFHPTAGGLGLAFPSPTNQLMQNLNMMLPSSNSGSPKFTGGDMMQLSGRSGLPSHANSGQNSVIMSPAMLSPANGTMVNGQMNTQAIQQQIAHLQSMLNQQNQLQAKKVGGPGGSPNGFSQFQVGNSTGSSPAGSIMTSAMPPPSRPAKFDFTPSTNAAHPPFHPATAHGGNLNSPPNHSQSAFATENPASLQQQPQPPQQQQSPTMPSMSPSSFSSSGSSDGAQSAGTMQYTIKQEPVFPSSPVLPGSRMVRDRANNGLYHSFDSQPGSGQVSVHSSLSSLPDTTRENTSAESSNANSLRNSADNLAHGLANQSFYSRGDPRVSRAPSSFSSFTPQQPQQQAHQPHQPLHQSQHQPQQQLQQDIKPILSPGVPSASPSEAGEMSMPLDQFKNPMSSIFWNPPNPHPPASVAHSHASLPDVSSPDFLCRDLFQQDGSQVPHNFFASPLVDSGNSSNSGSAGSSPVMPIGAHGHVHRPSASTLAAAMKVPAHAVNSGMLSPGSNGSGRSAHKRKKATTNNKKKRRGGSSVGERKLYSLSPKLWNMQVKRPPFRSTLTIGKHTDKFKTSDQIQVKFGGAFLEAGLVDQYKKHLLIDIPPPPNPTSLLNGAVSASASGPLDLTHTSVEVDLELHLNGVRVFHTVFKYLFGGTAELSTSSSSEEDSDEDSDDGSDDEDSMDDGARGNAGSSGSSGSRDSPDRDDGNGRRDGANGGSKRHKSGWNADGYGRNHASAPPQAAVRLGANFEAIPLFSTGVLKAYPLLNAGLQDLLHNYLLHDCLSRAEAVQATNVAPETTATTTTPKRYKSRAHSGNESNSEEERRSSSSPPRDEKSAPSTPSHRSYRVIAGGAAHTAARVSARLMFVQALTGSDPMTFVHTALRAAIAAASTGATTSHTLSHGSIDAMDSFGFSLLHYTVSVGDLPLTELLLSLGASSTIKPRRNAMYAFTPAELVQLRVDEAEKEQRKCAARASQPNSRPTSSVPLSTKEHQHELAHHKKKRRTSAPGDNANDSCSEDSTMSENTSTAPSPLLSNAIPFSSHFASLRSSPPTSLASTPTNHGRTLFKSPNLKSPGLKSPNRLVKSFHFGVGLDKAHDAQTHALTHQQEAVHAYHVRHSTGFGKNSPALCPVSPTATTAAPTPSSSSQSLLSSPSLNLRNLAYASPSFTHLSPPSPVAKQADRLTTQDPREVNDQLSSLFKNHSVSAAPALTTDSASEMSDRDTPSSTATTSIVGSLSASPVPGSSATGGLLHISAELESYLEARWLQVQRKKLAAQAAKTPSGASSLTQEDTETQRELVMLELALLAQHAQKQIQALDLDLPESAQSAAVDSPVRLSSPLQSLHIHTLRSLLAQFHLLAKYFASYQRHKFEQEQMKSLVAEIDQVGFSSTEPAAAADSTDMKIDVIPIAPTLSRAVSTASTQALNDATIHSLFTHVNSIEVQLRAAILHMQQCLAPYITRALSMRKQQKDQQKQAKIAAAAAMVASAVNANYTPTGTKSSSPHALGTPLSAGHLSRTHSGQLSLNIVGSLHPDEDDDSSRIEVREIHGVDVINERRIDLTLSHTIVAEETQAAAERNISRRLHAQSRVYEQQPPLEKIVEQVAVSGVSTHAHIPSSKVPQFLSVAPFSTPAASPAAGALHNSGFHFAPDPAQLTASVALVAAAVNSASEVAMTDATIPAARGNKFALLIGINQYSPALHIPALLGCENDVARIGSIIHSKYGFDLARCRAVDDAEDIVFAPGARTQALLNAGATRLAIRRALISLVSAVTLPQDTLLLYFAGHGFAECLIAADGMLDYSEITHLLRDLRTRDVSFVSDTCAGHTVESATTNQVRNTTLTLEEMRDLVNGRDLLAQQHAAAEILAAISPQAPGIRVIAPNGSGASSVGYEGDEEHMSFSHAMDSPSEDEPDSDADMEDDPPVKHSYRGLAFRRVEPGEPCSQAHSLPLEADEARVLPVIQRLFTRGKGAKGKGYFARGLLSREDPRASEVRVDGKWQGAFTARLCDKLEKFSMTDAARAEPANPGVISLASILFHDEHEGNLSSRERSSRSSSFSSCSGDEAAAFAASASWLAREALISVHQPDEIDPQLSAVDDLCVPAETDFGFDTVEDQEPAQDDEVPSASDICFSDEEPLATSVVDLASTATDESALSSADDEDDFLDQPIPDDESLAVTEPTSMAAFLAMLVAFACLLVSPLQRALHSDAATVPADAVPAVDAPAAPKQTEFKLAAAATPTVTVAADLLTTESSSDSSSSSSPSQRVRKEDCAISSDSDAFVARARFAGRW